MRRDGEKQYLISTPKAWVGRKISENNTKLVTRYSQAMEFSCEYNGESLGDEFVTNDIDKALDWLYR